jgi:hypothetical protein
MKKVKDNNRHPDPNQAGSREEKRKVSGEIHVRGEVEVDFAKTLTNKYDAIIKENKEQDHKHYRLAVTTLVVGIIYAGLTAWLAFSSQQSATAATKASKAAISSYESTVRPYIGSDCEIHPNRDKVGNLVNIDVLCPFKNYGSIPATEAFLKHYIFVDGIEVLHTHVNDAPTPIYPGESTTLTAHIAHDHAVGIFSGANILTIYTTYTYKWRDKKENGCEKFQYFSSFGGSVGGMGDLGPICLPSR